VKRRAIVLAVVAISFSAWSQEVKKATANGVQGNDDPAVTREDSGKIVIPSGTKLPLTLKQAISTKTARQGDPVYCETIFPYTVDDRIVIPAGTYVQGEISEVKRPGRVKGRAELLMHFTTMIFPNGYTVSMPGSVENVPGAENSRTTGDEGTIKAEGTKGRDAGTVAKTTGAGAGVGAIAAGRSGAGWGALAGGGAGLAAVLLSRGEDVRLGPGTGVEMVLQRPLTLDERRLGVPRR
jgi:hypothetical protein